MKITLGILFLVTILGAGRDWLTEMILRWDDKRRAAISRVFAVLMLALFCSTASAAYITSTVQITGTPADGDTLTVNGVVRTWKSTVTTPSSQITIAGSLALDTTNAYVQIGANPFTGLLVGYNAADTLAFQGNTLAVSASGTWATIVTTTISGTSAQVLRLPLTVELSAQRLALANYLVAGVDTFATTLFSAASPCLANYSALTTAQIISGFKTFSAANVYSNAAQVFSGGTVTNVVITNAINISGNITNLTNGVLYGTTISNAPAISGNVSTLTNGAWLNPSFTNGQNFGSPFRSPGSATESEQFGTGASATANFAVAFGSGATASGLAGVALGNGAVASNTTAIAIGIVAAAGGDGSVAIGGNSTATNTAATALGNGTFATNDWATVIGQGAVSTAAHQVTLGTAAEYVSILGGLSVGGSITNIHALGINTIDGDVELFRKDNSSLANGNNAAVDVSTNSLVRLGIGPTGAFTINGIAGGRNGRFLFLENVTGQVLTLANDSGVDPTAANRIKTGTGADVTIGNNPGWALLVYDSGLARWSVAFKSN